MNKAFLMGVSALALAMATPALAETVKTETGNAVRVEGPNTHTKADDARNAGKIDEKKVERALNNTGEAIENTANDVADAVSEGYRDMRDYFRGDQSFKDTKSMQVTTNQTATGMIGQPVKDVGGKRIGKVHDIIIDREGNAQMVVVSDGGILGLGNKLAAFDSSVIIKRDPNGDVISSLTQEAIDNVAEFSYDTKKAGDNKVRTMPAGGISVAKVLDADLMNPENKAVASVDNVTFRNGQADLLIVTFNKVLGIGGEKAAMNFDDLALVENGKDVDFRLTAQQAARFENAKETSASN